MSFKEIIKPSVLKLSLFSLILIGYLWYMRLKIINVLRVNLLHETPLKFTGLLDTLFFIGIIIGIYIITIIVDIIYHKIKE